MKRIMIALLVLGIGALAWSHLYACGGGTMGTGAHPGTHQGGDMTAHSGAAVAGHQADAVAGTTGGSINNPGVTGPAHTPAKHLSVEQHQEILSQDQARTILEDYLQSISNQHLTIADISETADYYEAGIVAPDGSLVDKIKVDKHSGVLQSVFAAQ